MTKQFGKNTNYFKKIIANKGEHAFEVQVLIYFSEAYENNKRIKQPGDSVSF